MRLSPFEKDVYNLFGISTYPIHLPVEQKQGYAIELGSSNFAAIRIVRLAQVEPGQHILVACSDAAMPDQIYKMEGEKLTPDIFRFSTAVAKTEKVLALFVEEYRGLHGMGPLQEGLMSTYIREMNFFGLLPLWTVKYTPSAHCVLTDTLCRNVMLFSENTPLLRLI